MWGTSSRLAPRISIISAPSCKRRRWAPQSYATPAGNIDQATSASTRSDMSKTVVTRFAPSPTGFLHIGGARTALFNWLYAKHTGGKMLLRIEDTDQARSTEGAILAILDGLRWLELDWDGEPVYQLARAERHREVAEQLLAEGKAYRCYATAEELTAMREEQKAAGKPMRYDGRWRTRNPGPEQQGK